jgi:hypothetical protein
MLPHNWSGMVGAVLYEIDDEHGCVQSLWPDGKCVNGVFNYTEEDVQRARKLGYEGGDADVCEQMHREHDLAHHLVMQAIGWDSSLVLRRIAEGCDTHPPGLGQLEERLAFLLQRASNVGITGIVTGG